MGAHQGRVDTMYQLLRQRDLYLRMVKISLVTNQPIADHPIWHASPFGQDIRLPIDNFDEDTAFAHVHALIDDELNSTGRILDLISRTKDADYHLTELLRTVELEDEVPDCRAVSQNYIEKQDVEYCVVRVGDNQRLCCKTAAIELANTYVAVPLEEQTVENFSLWFARSGRFNMSMEARLNSMVGTIAYATSLIKKQRAQLGLPTIYRPSRLDRIFNVITTLRKSWQCTDDKPVIPKILSSIKFLSALPYGVFGVRNMRPIKQDF